MGYRFVIVGYLLTIPDQRVFIFCFIFFIDLLLSKRFFYEKCLISISMFLVSIFSIVFILQTLCLSSIFFEIVSSKYVEKWFFFFSRFQGYLFTISLLFFIFFNSSVMLIKSKYGFFGYILFIGQYIILLFSELIRFSLFNKIYLLLDQLLTIEFFRRSTKSFYKFYIFSTDIEEALFIDGRNEERIQVIFLWNAQFLILFWLIINNLLIMNDELSENLLMGGKKSSKQYKKKIDEVQSKIKVLKNKNNSLQRQRQSDITGDIRKAMRQQQKFIESEIKQLKRLLEQLGQKHRDPISKNKLKELCTASSRQIQRYNQIVQDLFSYRASFGSILFENKQNRKSKSMGRQSKEQIRQQKLSNSIYQDRFDEQELSMQIKNQKQRTKLLKSLQAKNEQIHGIMNDIGKMVQEDQKDALNQVTNNLEQVNENVENTNEQMGEAIKLQKKAKKKYLCIGVIIVILLIIGGGIVWVILK